MSDEHNFLYIECDIEPGVTIDEYRRSRPMPVSRRKQITRWVLGLGR